MDYPQLAAISVFGTPRRLAGEQPLFPVPPFPSPDAKTFEGHWRQRPLPYFSRPLSGKVMQSDIFTTNMARVGKDGVLLGVVSIALKRQYFSEFHADLTNSNPALLVGLYRQDGTILAGLPDVGTLSNPAPDTPFTIALGQAVKVGRVNMVSTVDGVERILSFRRVGRYRCTSRKRLFHGGNTRAMAQTPLRRSPRDVHTRPVHRALVTDWLSHVIAQQPNRGSPAWNHWKAQGGYGERPLKPRAGLAFAHGRAGKSGGAEWPTISTIC